MEYIKVTNENIEKEHICCAISNNNDIQVSSKKAWLSERFEDGLVFLKSTERGKCFIEYIHLLKMHGIRFQQMDICILIVCGLRVRLKGMVIHQIY